MQQDNKYAGFTIRLLAHIIDIIIWALILLAFYFLFFRNPIPRVSADYKVIANVISYWLSAGMICAPLIVLYSSYFISKFGGTLGMLIFKLKVVDVQTGELLNFKKSFYRIIIGHKFSGKFFGLGFLSMIKHPQKQTWHDQLFETYVIVE